jgi:hypothetical protein
MLKREKIEKVTGSRDDKGKGNFRASNLSSRPERGAVERSAFFLLSDTLKSPGSYGTAEAVP